MNNKFLNLLGLCKKAKKLSLGLDMTIDSIMKKKSVAIFITSDLSTNSLKKVENVAFENKITIIKIPYSMIDIQSALSKKCGIISINDTGFANSFKKLLDYKEDF